MPIEPSALMTVSLVAAPWGMQVARILASALGSVDPGKAVQRYMLREGDELVVNGKTYDLTSYKRILLVGAGKAGAPMMSAVVGILGDRLNKGIAITKEGYANLGSIRQKNALSARNSSGLNSLFPNVELLEARHPIPDQRGIQGTERILDLLKETGKDDLVICILSGGGSALMTAPAPGIMLAELQNLTSALLARGATINEINSIRKHIDQVKGGGLVRSAPQATMITLILSDVVGDAIDVIASGPTVPDTSTYSQAYAVLERFDLLNTVPASITNHLKKGMRGEIKETLKTDDPAFKNVQNVVIGSNQQAAKAAVAQAVEEGYHASLLTTFLQGEARQAGRVLAAIVQQVNASGDPLPRPACLVCGGETTVTLSGNGVGGRNQELALGAVMELSGIPNVALVTLATDGGDGPTDAAGAVVTGETVERARVLGLNPQQYLAHNDSYHFFEALGDLLRPGPTQTNVNDLAFIFAF